MRGVKALYFLSTDATWDKRDLKIGEIDFGSMENLTNETLTSVLPIHEAIQSGTYYLLVLPSRNNRFETKKIQSVKIKIE